MFGNQIGSGIFAIPADSELWGKSNNALVITAHFKHEPANKVKLFYEAIIPLDYTYVYTPVNALYRLENPDMELPKTPDHGIPESPPDWGQYSEA
jgi:hypothetical protein